jgi:hypothetical protein
MRSCTPDAWRMFTGGASRRVLLGCVLLALVLLVPVALAQAATLAVTGTGDAGGTCNGGTCTSLRAAIEQADKDGGNDTVQIPGGGYQLSSGKLAITASMTLAGAGATSTKILAAPSSQIITVSGSGQVTIADVTLEGASVFHVGGAVEGGGSAAITIQRAIISHNESKGGVDGGGVYDVSTRPLLIEASTLSNNTAKGGGALDGTAPITVLNSTFTGNVATNDGGALEDGRTTLINDTITGNKCNNGTGCGGGVTAVKLEAGFALTARDTILAGNTDGKGALNNCLAIGGSVEAAIGATGPNLENGTDCKFKSAGGLEGEALLGPLGDNGGPTPTMLPGSGSPAINAGKNCAPQDQRGHTRPTPAGPCDLGSVETEARTSAPTVGSIAPSSGTTAGGAPVTIKGAGFLKGATVMIGSAATAVNVVSETEITATTPAHAAGATEVVVTDSKGTSAGGPTYSYLGGEELPLLAGDATSTFSVPDLTSVGREEAFQFTARASGTVEQMQLRTNATPNTGVTGLDIGVLAESSGKPGAVLGHAVLSGEPPTSSWVTVSGLSVPVTGGTKYWLVVLPLGAAGSKLHFGAAASSGGTGNVESVSGGLGMLTAQSSWTTWNQGPVGFQALGKTSVAQPTVTIEGAPASMAAGSSVQLTAHVSNDSPTVTWGASAGAITTGGFYTAPAKPPAGGTVTVTATTSKGATDQRTIEVTANTTKGLLAGDATSTYTIADQTSVGREETFQFTAKSSGTVKELQFRTNSTANTGVTGVELGVFAENAGKPGAVLGKAIVPGQPAANSWVNASGLSIPVVSGTKYWLAVLALGTAGEQLHFNAATVVGGGTGNLESVTSGLGTLTPESSWDTYNQGPVGFQALGN